MMRKNIVNIVNELAAGQGINFELKKCYNLILEYCKGNNTLYNPRKNKYEIVNGVLSINGKNIERVEPLIRPFNIYDEESEYYENRILATAENYSL